LKAKELGQPIATVGSPANLNDYAPTWLPPRGTPAQQNNNTRRETISAAQPPPSVAGSACAWPHGDVRNPPPSAAIKGSEPSGKTNFPLNFSPQPKLSPVATHHRLAEVSPHRLLIPRAQRISLTSWCFCPQFCSSSCR
jgi:hypothetical protein